MVYEDPKFDVRCTSARCPKHGRAVAVRLSARRSGDALRRHRFWFHGGAVAVPSWFRGDAVSVGYMDQCTGGDFRAARFHLTAALPVSSSPRVHWSIWLTLVLRCLAEGWRQPCVALAVRVGALSQGPAGVSL